MKFDSEKECEEALKDLIQNPTTPDGYQAAAKATLKARMNPLSIAEMTKRTAESQCVLADDPRLKVKVPKAAPPK